MKTNFSYLVYAFIWWTEHIFSCWHVFWTRFPIKHWTTFHTTSRQWVTAFISTFVPEAGFFRSLQLGSVLRHVSKDCEVLRRRGVGLVNDASALLHLPRRRRTPSFRGRPWQLLAASPPAQSRRLPRLEVEPNRAEPRRQPTAWGNRASQGRFNVTTDTLALFFSCGLRIYSVIAPCEVSRNATPGRRLTTCKWAPPSRADGVACFHASSLHAEPWAAHQGRALSRIACWLSTFYAASKWWWWWHRFRRPLIVFFRKRKSVDWSPSLSPTHTDTHTPSSKKSGRTSGKLVCDWTGVLQLLQVCAEHRKASLCHYRAAMLLGN